MGKRFNAFTNFFKLSYVITGIAVLLLAMALTLAYCPNSCNNPVSHNKSHAEK